jgi:fatty aldehyde-generating acyl-ACP reductase
MDSTPSGLDFAVIAHQDSWPNITSLINGIRTDNLERLSTDTIRNIFSFIPPRDIFKIHVKSKTGSEVNGVYIESFIDPDKLDIQHIRTNITKVKKAVSFANKSGAKITALGGFTSIILEGDLHGLPDGGSAFTTGNTLTAAYIVKGIENAAIQLQIDCKNAHILIVGATGDIGMACIEYFKHKAGKILLCARNNQRLLKLSDELKAQNVSVQYSGCMEDLVPDADIIICAASSTGMKVSNYKKGVLICDAGFPKNLETSTGLNKDLHVFHGGMGFISYGYSFNPDYTAYTYRQPDPKISHGCIIEAIVLALENKYEPYSAGKGNITVQKMEEIYALSIKHGIELAPFYNASGFW